MTNVQNVRQMPATFGMKFGTAKRFGNTTLGSLGIWISKMFPSCWSLQRLLYMVLEKYKVSAVSDVIHIAGLVECINNWRNIALLLGKWSKEMTADLCLGLKYQFCNAKKYPASLTNKCFNYGSGFSRCFWAQIPLLGVRSQVVLLFPMGSCRPLLQSVLCPCLLSWQICTARSQVNKQNGSGKGTGWKGGVQPTADTR